MSEIWKNIEDFPGYQVSNLGRVRSFWSLGGNSRILPTFRILSQRPIGAGYRYMGVALCAGGQRKMCYVHRLVWKAFYGDIPEGLVIDHINRFSKDNRLENLRLATRSQNARNRTKNLNKASKYLGVRFHSKTRTWHAEINVRGVIKSLGYYKEESDAARARDNALREYLDEIDLSFCKFNFIN